MHRDIKPENLLFESLNANSRLKIIDFGVSTEFQENSAMNHKCGTAYYVAPEILHGSYNEKVDI